MYFPRVSESFIRAAAQQFPVLLVTGARQVGKTTLLRHLSGKDRTYLTLDDPLLLELVKRDPALFMQRFPPPVLIDEIQYAPELLPYIKMQVDRQRQAGQFWLTGSQQFHLMRGISESLAGRVGVVQLLGLSRREALGLPEPDEPFLPTAEILESRLDALPAVDLKSLYQQIWRGSYPAIALNPQLTPELFYGSYVQTYLQRDLRDLAKVGDELAFLRFLRVAAARTGQLLNFADLARDADIAPNTAKQWLSILQASGIVYLLEPWHNNLNKRLVKAPKLYFLDTGLCAYLTAWSSPETLEAGAMSGAILETWILVELLKSYWHRGRQAPFFHYRDKDGKEIDLLIVQDGKLYPLEFKKTASPRPQDLRHFGVLRGHNLPVGAGGMVCLTARLLPLGENLEAIPIAAL